MKMHANARRKGPHATAIACSASRRCPKCRKRNGRRAFIGRYALMFAVLAPLMFLLGLLWPVFDHSIRPDEAHVFRTWVPVFVTACIALIMVPVAIVEWRGIDRRVRWLDF